MMNRTNHNLTFNHNRCNHQTNQHAHAYRPPQYDPNCNANAPPITSNNRTGFKALPPQPPRPLLSLLRSPLATPNPPCDHTPPSKPPLPSILLPSLLSTANTNANSWTDRGTNEATTAHHAYTTVRIPPKHRTPMPAMSTPSVSVSGTPGPQPIPFLPTRPVHAGKENRVRKRKATEMMTPAECPSEMLICDQSKKAKRQKTERRVTRHKTVRKASHCKKMQVAVAQLKAFQHEHNGRLPSLRYVMKLLKVGFPKAHDIMEEYAREIGKSKTQVIQEMTIRQEKTDRPTNNIEDIRPHKSRTRSLSKKKKTTKSNMSINCNNAAASVARGSIAAHAVTPRGTRLPTDFSKRLGVLVAAVANDETWDSFEKQYLWNLNKLEVFLDEFVTDSSLQSMCTLVDKVEIASAYYMLSEMYFTRYHKLRVGYEYNQRSLSLWKECNAIINKGGGTGSGHMAEYTGAFWREFAEIFVQRGEMLLESDDWKGAQHNYELSYNLVQRVSTKDVESKNKFLRQSLNKLTIIHCYQKQYAVSAKYGKQLYRELMKSGAVVPALNIIGIKNIIESKAWLSCTLMMSSAAGDYAQGYQYYKEILNECRDKIDANDPFYIYRLFCYFAEHFIKTKEWKEAHALMERILGINEYLIGDAFKSELHGVFKVYVEGILAVPVSVPVPMDGFREKVNKIMAVLMDKHINVVNHINISAKMQQKEYKKRNERLKRKGANNNNNNKEEMSDDDYNEDIDLILSDKFNYNVHETYNSLYPKINIASVLINQITLLLSIGNIHAAHQILYSLVIPRAKCLNATSKYWQHYPIEKVNQNEINALLSLL